MRGVPWSKEIAVGRVFQLRSSAKDYPPPCALVIRESGWETNVVPVDRFGCVSDGLYARRHNPNIYVRGLRGKDLTKRIVGRRCDLERFDRDDIDLMRWGCAIDFDGRIDTERIPLVNPGTWTVFFTPPYEDDFP